MTGADDASLLAATARGDRTAFEGFVERHGGPVHRYLRAAAAQPADADDAFQETFLAAWRAAEAFRGGASARAWIVTIARNALRRLHRRRAGEPTVVEALDDLESLGLAAGWGAATSGESALEDRDLLRWALAGLSPEDREILVLRDVEGFTGAEVAALLGLSGAAQKSRLHRARLRLVARLRTQTDAPDSRRPDR